MQNLNPVTDNLFKTGTFAGILLGVVIGVATPVKALIEKQGNPVEHATAIAGVVIAGGYAAYRRSIASGPAATPRWLPGPNLGDIPRERAGKE